MLFKYSEKLLAKLVNNLSDVVNFSKRWIPAYVWTSGIPHENPVPWSLCYVLGMHPVEASSVTGVGAVQWGWSGVFFLCFSLPFNPEALHTARQIFADNATPFFLSMRFASFKWHISLQCHFLIFNPLQVAVMLRKLYIFSNKMKILPHPFPIPLALGDRCIRP